MDFFETALLGVEQSASHKRWVMPIYDEYTVQSIRKTHNLPEILSRIFVQRNIKNEDIVEYLNPTLRHYMPNPSCLKDMDNAAKRLAQAIVNDEKVAVFGDYDVDGATSSALLDLYFKALDKSLRVYIPNRVEEGYGPNISAFRKLSEESITLIITVDCGTMAYDALDEANRLGIDVIIADHHKVGEELPKCFALINPQREDDKSGLEYLAAVGVTYMLLVALNRTLRNDGYFKNTPPPDLRHFLDIVALGTICDVVPLTGLNRAFVSQGLKVMAQSKNLGLLTLMDMSKITTAPTVFDCGFRLGPRINAGGRIGNSHMGVQLLTSSVVDEATSLAMYMDDLNTERRMITQENQALAEKQIAEIIHMPSVIVLASPLFHVGVIGIVAGSIKDKYNRPCFIISLKEEGMGKGSARSVHGVDIGACVTEAVQKGLISSGGGHAMAAGITLEYSQLDTFKTYLSHNIDTAFLDKPLNLKINAAISPSGVTGEMFQSIQQVGPFGAENPEPCFVMPHMRIIQANIVGENHVSCILSDEQGEKLKAIAFSSTHENIRQMLMWKKPLHVVGYLRMNEWKGKNTLQFIIRDVAPLSVMQ